MLNIGDIRQVNKIHGRDETRRFLESLGFVAGSTVSIVSENGGKLAGEGPVRRRIMDMGVTKGTQIFIRKVAPLGDPIEVTVRGYELSIRKSEAENIHIH